MPNEDLSEIKSVLLGVHETRCPLCEEGMYSNVIYHICKNEENGRFDLVHCDQCNYLIVIQDRKRIELNYLDAFACECEDENNS